MMTEIIPDGRLGIENAIYHHIRCTQCCVNHDDNIVLFNTNGALKEFTDGPSTIHKK
jgi:hypothetical protein